MIFWANHIQLLDRRAFAAIASMLCFPGLAWLLLVLKALLRLKFPFNLCHAAKLGRTNQQTSKIWLRLGRTFANCKCTHQRYNMQPSHLIRSPPLAIAPQERYLVETKLSGRTVGSTLFVVAAKARDGSVTQVKPGQSFKLFLASRLNF